MSEEFGQIKRELIKKVDDIQKHINADSLQREEVRILLKNVSVAVFGDPMANPPLEGYQHRLKRIEDKIDLEEKDRQKNKDNMISLAVGSLAIALGGAIIWVCIAIKEAFFRGH